MRFLSLTRIHSLIGKMIMAASVQELRRPLNSVRRAGTLHPRLRWSPGCSSVAPTAGGEGPEAGRLLRFWEQNMALVDRCWRCRLLESSELVFQSKRMKRPRATLLNLWLTPRQRWDDDGCQNKCNSWVEISEATFGWHVSRNELLEERKWRRMSRLSSSSLHLWPGKAKWVTCFYFHSNHKKKFHICYNAHNALKLLMGHAWHLSWICNEK